jgi:hypothetical protein
MTANSNAPTTSTSHFGTAIVEVPDGGGDVGGCVGVAGHVGGTPAPPLVATGTGSVGVAAVVGVVTGSTGGSDSGLIGSNGASSLMSVCSSVWCSRALSGSS